MEPLSTSTIAILAFGGIFDQTIGQSTETALAKRKELLKKIQDTFRRNLDAATALAAVERGSQKSLEKVAAFLDEFMKIDADFAQQIHLLAKEIKEVEKQNISIGSKINSGSIQDFEMNLQAISTSMIMGYVFNSSDTIPGLPGDPTTPPPPPED